MMGLILILRSFIKMAAVAAPQALTAMSLRELNLSGIKF